MKRLVLVLMILLQCGTAWATQDVSALARKTLPGVVVIYAEKRQGSGFFVTPKGDIVTNYHVVRNKKNLRIRTETGNFYPARLRAYDQNQDIALLSTDTPGFEYRVLTLASEIPPTGTAIYALGAPLGYEKTISDGLVSQVRKNGLQISCPISPGSSGGPVLNMNGEVVGMVRASHTSAQNINFAVPAPVIRLFIAQNGDASSFSQSQNPSRRSAIPTPPEPAQNARSGAERYAYLGESNGNQLYIDKHSIKQRGRFVKFAALMRAPSSRVPQLKNDDIAFIDVVSEIDVYARKIRLYSVVYRNKERNILKTEGVTTPWMNIVPDSPDDNCYDYILNNVPRAQKK
ncbi:MAG: serine protease [Synergistaceae bacterium]|jgi:hypothetical protein|nr:serine protease [Synergistaceae bacterium]